MPAPRQWMKLTHETRPPHEGASNDPKYTWEHVHNGLHVRQSSALVGCKHRRRDA